jgi:hypothetical protein
VPWQRLVVKVLRRARATKPERRDKEATVERIGASREAAALFNLAARF